MTSSITRLTPTDLSPTDADLEGVRHYAERARSENTYRAYRSAWARFVGWCSEEGLTADLRAPSDPDELAKVEAAVAVRLTRHLAFMADEGFGDLDHHGGARGFERRVPSARLLASAPAPRGP